MLYRPDCFLSYGRFMAAHAAALLMAMPDAVMPPSANRLEREVRDNACVQVGWNHLFTARDAKRAENHSSILVLWKPGFGFAMTG